MVSEAAGGKWVEVTSSYRFFDMPKRWEYYDASGKAVSGWQKISGKWYYFAPGKKGTAQEGKYITACEEYRQGYWLNRDGSWTYKPKASWHKDSHGWWYGDKTGWYAKGQSYWIDGVQYVFDANGYLQEWETDIFSQGNYKEYDGCFEDNSNMPEDALYYLRGGFIRKEYYAVVETNGKFYGAVNLAKRDFIKNYTLSNGEWIYSYLGHDISYYVASYHIESVREYYTGNDSKAVLAKLMKRTAAGKVEAISLCNVQKTSKVHFYTRDGKYAFSLTGKQLWERSYFAVIR